MLSIHRAFAFFGGSVTAPNETSLAARASEDAVPLATKHPSLFAMSGEHRFCIDAERRGYLPIATEATTASEINKL